MFKIAKIIVLFILFLSIPLICSKKEITLTVAYNNVPLREDLTTAWGISIFIEGLEKTILFDAGGDGFILLSNMEKLKLDPEKVELIVLSHIHADHVGGLEKFLERNDKVSVYLPSSFPTNFKNKVKKKAGEVISVKNPLKICNQVWSTGELGISLKEQALVIETKKGLIVITGCAHPGIVDIVKFAKSFFGKPIYLVAGGFHLISCSEKQVKEIIRQLKNLDVEKVAPSHCTGGRPIELFKEAWGIDFIDLGCGARIKISFE
jgi:7,8-dihydropterin-6-yl-methyl-4-(beta-D-ribofuranosyl)aminobenzene 5'-phosphate synthase